MIWNIQSAQAVMPMWPSYLKQKASSLQSTTTVQQVAYIESKKETVSANLDWRDGAQ